MQRQCRLTAGLRSVDLDDPPFRVSADAQRLIDLDGAGADGIHIDCRAFAQLHDGALAVLFLDLLDRIRKQSVFLVVLDCLIFHYSFPCPSFR